MDRLLPATLIIAAAIGIAGALAIIYMAATDNRTCLKRENKMVLQTIIVGKSVVLIPRWLPVCVTYAD